MCVRRKEEQHHEGVVYFILFSVRRSLCVPSRHSLRFDKITLLLEPLAHTTTHSRKSASSTEHSVHLTLCAFIGVFIARDTSRAYVCAKREISQEVKLCCCPRCHRLRSRCPSDRRGEHLLRHMAAHFSLFSFSERKKELSAASVDSPRAVMTHCFDMITAVEGRALRQDKTHL